jgi:hypothetical protein
MSQIGIATDTNSQAAPQARSTPHRFVAPAKAPWARINLRVALLVSLALLLIGGPFLYWLRLELSRGIIRHGDYSEVNLKAMSNFDMDQSNGTEADVPARFRALDGSRVALDGEMWNPTDAGDSVKYFQLVYSIAKCCFNGPPLAQHFVDSNVIPGHSVDFYRGTMVRVWGTMHIRFRREAGVIKSVYQVDVDEVDPLN